MSQSPAPSTNATPDGALLRTPLHDWHVALGARMVPFAGYDMPVQYPAGLMAEHRHGRSAAALFDVSHMGQIVLEGADAARALESVVPVDVMGLAQGQQRYAFFTNEQGGLLDDLMVTRPAPDAHLGDLYLVVNAGCKDADLAYLRERIGSRCRVVPRPDRALLALQGPQAAAVLTTLNPRAGALRFMQAEAMSLAGIACFVSRSGYTGEDGYEISLPAGQAMALAQTLAADPRVMPAGLGARDTLRLEAGLCLYGHDIGPQTSPVGAQLQWAIQKVRRPGGERAGGYPGADVIGPQLAPAAGVPAPQPPQQLRVGLVGLDRTPVREGAELQAADGTPIGRVSSGTVSPSLGKPIAMAWVDRAHTAVGTTVQALVRGKPVPMQITTMPFTPHRYWRG